MAGSSSAAGFGIDLSDALGALLAGLATVDGLAMSNSIAAGILTDSASVVTGIGYVGIPPPPIVGYAAGSPMVMSVGRMMNRRGG